MAFYYGAITPEIYEEFRLHNIACNYANMYNNHKIGNRVKLNLSEIKLRMYKTRVDSFHAGFILDFIYNSCGYIEKVRFIDPGTDEITTISILPPRSAYIVVISGR